MVKSEAIVSHSKIVQSKDGKQAESISSLLPLKGN